MPHTRPRAREGERGPGTHLRGALSPGGPETREDGTPITLLSPHVVVDSPVRADYPLDFELAPAVSSDTAGIDGAPSDRVP